MELAGVKMDARPVAEGGGKNGERSGVPGQFDSTRRQVVPLLVVPQFDSKRL